MLNKCWKKQDVTDLWLAGEQEEIPGYLEEYNIIWIQELPEPDKEHICQMILRHAQMQVQLKGENMGIKEMRKHIAWYTAGLPHSAAVRRQCNQVETMEELEKLLENSGFWWFLILDNHKRLGYNTWNVTSQTHVFMDLATVFRVGISEEIRRDLK